jgi:hypothetical protein
MKSEWMIRLRCRWVVLAAIAGMLCSIPGVRAEDDAVTAFAKAVETGDAGSVKKHVASRGRSGSDDRG